MTVHGYQVVTVSEPTVLNSIGICNVLSGNNLFYRWHGIMAEGINEAELKAIADAKKQI